MIGIVTIYAKQWLLQLFAAIRLFLAIPAMVTCGFSLSLCLCNLWWVPAMQLGSQLSNGQ